MVNSNNYINIDEKEYSDFLKNKSYYESINTTLKATPDRLLNVQKYLVSKDEINVANYLEGIRTDILLYDYHTDDDNYYTSVPVHHIKEYGDFIKKSKQEKVFEGKLAYKRMESDIANNKFAFQKYNSTVKKEIPVQFTINDKIKYYKSRVNDKSLTEGQRNYAYNFLINNGVKL